MAKAPSTRKLPPWGEAAHRIPARRLRLFHDPAKPESAAVVAQLKQYESPDPEVIVVVGGDGMMLRAIRQHCCDGLPFYGINTGHIGFLLNDSKRLDFWDEELDEDWESP